MSLILNDAHKSLIRRMRRKEPLTSTRASGQFWIDTYDIVINSTAKELLLADIIAVDDESSDVSNISYELTETGKTIIL